MDGKNNSISIVTDSPILDEIEQGLLSGRDSYPKSILRVLAYEAKGFRFALLLILLMVLLPFSNRHLPILIQSAPSIQIMALSLVFTVLLFLDRWLFCTARELSRTALIEGYSGNYDSAKGLYRESMKGMISSPRDLYLLALGETLTLSGDLKLGDRYIAESMQQGASRRISIFYALRSRLFSARLSESDLEFLKEEISKDPILEIEMCWAYLAKLEYSQALNLSKKILGLQSILHPSGIETRDMALLTQSLSNLFLGRSEEALCDLDFSLKVLKGEINGIPTLVPYLSLAFLIRGRYFLRRSETHAKGEADVIRGLSLCRYPLHLEVSAI